MRAARSLPCLILAMSIGLAACGKDGGGLAGPPPAVEAPLALLAGRATLAGPPIDPGALAGKVVAINFWSPG